MSDWHQYVVDEIKARGWSVGTLAEMSMLSVQTVEEIVCGHRKMTPLTAYCLSQAFGTTVELWMNLAGEADADE